YNRLRRKINKNYELYKNEIYNLKSIDIDTKERQRQIDLLKFQIDEIDEVDLSKIDEDNLFKEYMKLENVKNIRDALYETMELLNGSDYRNKSVLDMLNTISSQLNHYKEYDDVIQSFHGRIESTIFDMQDLWNEMRSYK